MYAECMACDPFTHISHSNKAIFKTLHFLASKLSIY